MEQRNSPEQLWGKWIGEGRDGAGKVGDFCRNPGEGRQVMVTTRAVATKMNETTGGLCLQVGSTGLGAGMGVTEGGCRVSPGSCPELLGRWRSLEGGGNVQSCDSVSRSPWEPNSIIWMETHVLFLFLPHLPWYQSKTQSEEDGF